MARRKSKLGAALGIMLAPVGVAFKLSKKYDPPKRRRRKKKLF